MRAGLVALTVCVACASDWTAAPSIEPPGERSGVYGAVRVRVSTATRCDLEVVATAGDHERILRVPEVFGSVAPVLWGLRPGRTYDVDVRCGGARWSTEWRAAALPDTLPELTVLAHDPDRMEPGYTLLDLSGPGEADWLVVLDDALEIVWAQRQPSPFYLAAVAEPGGTLLGQVYPWIVRSDWMGERQARWVPEAEEAGDVALGWPLHHEALPLPGQRVLGLTWRPLEVDAYPTSEDTPDDLAPATIADDGVIVFAEDGTVEVVHWLSEVLDTRRIGFGSLSTLSDDGAVRDWAHANAVVPDPSGGFLVTLRHQDAVVHLSNEGELDWILGAPGGWVGPQADARLEAEGALEWPFHPHAADIAPDGTIVVFDNGNHGRTPYDDVVPSGPRRSRAVGYTVGSAVGTVQQAWEMANTTLGTLYAPAFGDADPLPATGNVLAVFGRTREIAGVSNAASGGAESQVHLIEFSPEQPEVPALYLVFSSPPAAGGQGWASYRAERFEMSLSE